MSRLSRRRFFLAMTLQAVLLALLAALILPAWLGAQTCDRTGCGYATCAFPATPVPQSYWPGGSELQPVDPPGVALPAVRDSTNFNEFDSGHFQYSNTNWYVSLDVQNGYVFAGLAYGMQTWDARTTPASPTLLGSLTYRGFPAWVGGEDKWPIHQISLPNGVDTVAALAASNGIGLGIVNLSDKSNPKIAYQFNNVDAKAVYAAKIGGTNYAFLATAPGGLLVFNMDAAVQFQGCLDTAGAPPQCPGVALGQIGSSQASFVAGVDSFVVLTGGGGFAIYDVTNVQSPQLKLSGLNSQAIYGVAMWKDSGGKYYLGARSEDPGSLSDTLSIYDVSCIAGTCSGVPAPLRTLGFLEPGTERLFLTFSRSNATPFLYLGSTNYCGNPISGQPPSTQREWLLDVSNPAAPRDITPPTGYWGWYYRTQPTGFNLVDGHEGKFVGDYFYRAAFTIFDFHKHTGIVAPTAAFTYSPAQIYPGTPVAFTDQSSGGSLSYAWTFAPDGSPASSNVQNPVGVTFAAKGAKTVSLKVTNSAGPNGNTATQTIQVLDPVPQVGGISVSPPSPLQCQPVTLTATGVTGAPTLAYGWQITNASNQPASGGTSTANPFVWDTKANSVPAGSYTAKVTVTNSAGNGTKSATIALGSLATLPADGTFAPTDDAFTAGTVQFHVVAAGATEWNWSFGDNPGGGPAADGYSGWTNDPAAGPNPSHTYTAVGNYAVKVKVRNCVNIAGQTGAALNVNVTVTTPLKARFDAQGCSNIGGFFVCNFNVNQPITFVDSSTGASFWDYDWDGSNAFADSGHAAPVTTHTYAIQGTFTPQLRVRRGASEQNVYTHGAITIASPNPPSISVGGPTSGQPGQPYTYSASASNCSPAAWSWSTGGGIIGGDATSASISVTWSSPGTYVVSASNAGCGSASGSVTVSISTSGGPPPPPPPPPGTPLASVFTYSPATPKVGDTVTFDGTSSTGTPTGYSWTFGDGTNGSGGVVTHVFTADGSFVVHLSVTAPGSGSNCLFGTCAADSAQTVTVAKSGPPPPPPLNPDFTVSGGGVQCSNVGGLDVCTVATGQPVTFTALETGATTYNWSFGDDTTDSGQSVTHTWSQPGSFAVQLTVSAQGKATSSKQRAFTVSGPPPPPPTSSVLLPWIAATSSPQNQTTDLYVLNPTAGSLDATITYFKRGLPESPAPAATKTIGPGATLFIADALHNLFGRDNTAGFLTVTVAGAVEPVVTSFNTITGDSGKFGQSVLGSSLAQKANKASAPASDLVQHLIGLNDNSDQVSGFGVSNPNQDPTNYHLKFFDNTGQKIGESSGDLLLPNLGQKQFRVGDIHNLFNVSGFSDYRVEVDNTGTGGKIYPYASSLRPSGDPSFIPVARTGASRLYVIGAFSTSGTWQTDIVLANVGDQQTTTSMTYSKIGAASVPSQPVTVNLQPGQTQRLSNAIAANFNTNNTVGTITFDSTSPNGIFPVVQAESYNVAPSAQKFGQAMGAFTDADAAGPGQAEYLVGLRQDSDHATTIWLFNPGTENGIYDIQYVGLDGSVQGTISSVNLAPGRTRQFLPIQHKIKAGGVADGFTVKVVVNNGKALAAAQVVNLGTNDPSYVQGVSR
jgi:PKD repeat protein